MAEAAPARGLLKPESIYLILSGGYALFFNTAMNMALLFQTQEAGFDPFRLILIGTTLEVTRFLCEVPTGVVADVVSRKLSILIGLLLMGAGLTLSGAFTLFETILIAQVIWGLGYTFISGAKEAWIADEIGTESVGRVYLRSAQIDQVARISSIPIATGLGLMDLSLPIILGGSLFLPLAVFLAFAMPERGFKRRTEEERTSMAHFFSKFVDGSRRVRGSPLLITILCIAGLYGMASEGFSRLWIAHMFDNAGFPTWGNLEPIVWIGVIRIGAAVLGIAGVELIKRRIDMNSHAAISRTLFWIYGLQFGFFCIFSMAGSFMVGMIGFWGVISFYLAYTPLYLTWINQNVDSSVRATVISMNSQIDSLGQIVGGPPLGLIGSYVGLRAALLASAAVMVPGMVLYLRSFGQKLGRQAAAPTPSEP
jgi:DHA3 family tetracycline resistance protein-like MFS transporter